LDAFWKNDLPEGFDPMTAKELRQNLRRGSFVMPFLAIHVLALVTMTVEFKTGLPMRDTDYDGMLNPSLLWNSGPFWALAAAICVIIMPMGGFTLMAQELEHGNHELLVLTKLNRWKIVIGKFLSLWGLSAVTFISLLPYVVLRYFVGGIEWWHEAACAATVLGGSAIIGAGAIGASAFSNIGARLGILLLYLASMSAVCAAPLFGSAAQTRGCGILYHFTAVAAALCCTVIGLALARSRLRLDVMPFEVSPSGMMIGLLVFAPFVVGTVTAITIGYGGIVALLIVALVATRLDVTPKMPDPPA